MTHAFRMRDSDQPFDDAERMLIDEVFSLLEDRYGAQLWLIVYRTPDGDLVVQEPRQKIPDLERVKDKVVELGNFLIEARE